MNPSEQVEADVAKAVRFLSKHADSVVVIMTIKNQRLADGSAATVTYKHGSGNYYAQYGSVKQWVLDQERGEPPEPDKPDNGDEWKG